MINTHPCVIDTYTIERIRNESENNFEFSVHWNFLKGFLKNKYSYKSLSSFKEWIILDFGDKIPNFQLSPCCCCYYVHSLSHVWLFVIPLTAACRASRSYTVSWGLPKLLSTELIMPSNYLIPSAPSSSCSQSSQHQDLFQCVFRVDFF